MADGRIDTPVARGHRASATFQTTPAAFSSLHCNTRAATALTQNTGTGSPGILARANTSGTEPSASSSSWKRRLGVARLARLQHRHQPVDQPLRHLRVDLGRRAPCAEGPLRGLERR
jgi:hypothetical protein